MPDDLYKDYIEHAANHQRNMAGIVTDESTDNDSLECERTIYIKESDLAYLVETFESISKKMTARAKAARAKPSNGSVKGEVTADKWQQKADRINKILNSIGEQML